MSSQGFHRARIEISTAACMRAARAACAAALVAIFVWSPATAFDCDKARSRVEKIICADPATKAADDSLNEAFSVLRTGLSDPQRTALLTNQRRWLKDRDSDCLNDQNPAKCFRDQTASRVRALSGRPVAGPGTPDPLLPVFVERAGSKTAYEVSLLLYRFETPRSSAETRLNAWTDRAIKDAPTRTDDPSGTFSYSYSRTATIAFASDRLLSIQVAGYDFTGGAHGQSTSTTLNLDLKDGRELAIGDLLGAKELATIQADCRRGIAGELRSRFVESGEDPDKDAESKKTFADAGAGAADSINTITGDMTNWTFGANAATVTFVSDSIGPHALGDFTCEVPYARLRQLAKAAFPLP